MKLVCWFLILFCNLAWGQLLNTVELKEKLNLIAEESVRKEFLYLATLKSVEKFAPEMGYKYEDFSGKLLSKFDEYFAAYKEKQLVEKFGANYQSGLTEADKANFLSQFENERHMLFLKFSGLPGVLRSHSVSTIAQDPKDPQLWSGKVVVDLDKLKLEKLLRRITSTEKKPFNKVILVSEIDPFLFTWPELGLETDQSFMAPLNQSWLKWLNENLPQTVEEAVVCDLSCLDFYTKWTATEADQIILPEDFVDSILVKVSLHLKRSSNISHETTFDWEGRAVLLDLKTKRAMDHYTIAAEKRTFQKLDQKALNSALASSLYRSPLPGLMQFSRKLEHQVGFNRVAKLVIKGHQHLADVWVLMELLKTRGSSLGLDLSLSAFTRDQAHLVCFYRGEEKSFTDVLSGIKELKSSHSYTLVNEFTGVHYTLNLVTE